MAGVLKPSAEAFPSKQELAANPIVVRNGEPRAVDLALDLSSTCIGWAVGLNKEPHDWGKLVFKSTAEIGEKLVAVLDFMNFLLEFYKPTRLFVETTLSRHGDTTRRHNEILGIVRCVWRQHTEREILRGWFIPAKTVKAALGVELAGNHTENKRRMVEKINQIYGLNLVFSTSKLKSDDDIADALAVLKAEWTKSEIKKTKKKTGTKAIGKTRKNGSSIRKRSS